MNDDPEFLLGGPRARRFRLADHPEPLRDCVPAYARGVPAVLRKADLRGRAAAFVHRAARGRGLVLRSTSGSTGIPLTVHEGRSDQEVHHECYGRLYLMLPRDAYRSVAIRDVACSDDRVDAPRTFALHCPTLGRRIAHPFKVISCRETPARMLERLDDHRPQLVEGYPSAIELVARALVAQGRVLDHVEVLSPCGEWIDGRMRRCWARAFPRARVFARYGATELGPLGWDCPRCGRMHLNADRYAAEAGPQDRPRWSKRYVSAAQLHRYALGDRVRVDPRVTCPVGLPTLEILEGRRDAILRDRDGAPLPVMPYDFGDIPQLLQWQVVQRRDHRLELHAVVSEASGALTRCLRGRLEECLAHPRLPIEVRLVERITGGKLARTHSELSP